MAAIEAAAEATQGDASGNKATNASSSSSGWGSWGKMALYAGAGAALAGGAAAAYLKRDQLTEGWTWVSSHLEFVGCLAKGEDLRRRVAYMVRAHRELGVGFGNVYTRLGQGATARQQQVAGLGGTNMVGTVLGSQRTFCNLPSKKSGPDRSGIWEAAINDKASDEAGAHMCEYNMSILLRVFAIVSWMAAPCLPTALLIAFSRSRVKTFSPSFCPKILTTSGTQPCLNETRILHMRSSPTTLRKSFQNGR